MVSHKFSVNQTVLYTAPSTLTREAIIDALDGDLAYIAYILEDTDIEMTGWVKVDDLQPFPVRVAALQGDVTTINEAIAVDEQYAEWLDCIEGVR